MEKIKSCAVIAAAGSGRRMGGISKPNIVLLGKTLFEYVLCAVEHSCIDTAVVVCSEDNEASLRELAKGFSKPIRFVRGGSMRAESVYFGVISADEDTEVFCVHDCARPFITSEIIDTLVSAAHTHGVSCICAPVTDTVKTLDEDGNVSTLDRDRLFTVQTPQCFRRSLYLDALRAAGDGYASFTDETSLLESNNTRVEYIKSTRPNMKLTSVGDTELAEAIMKKILKGEEK